MVKFCGGFTDDTKVRDLITAHSQASEYRIQTCLRFNNRDLTPDELVSDVLKHGSLDLYFCLVDQYYFAFLDIDGTPADLPPQTFVHPIVEVREDTRSIEELVQEIEGIKEDSIENGNEKKIMRL